MRRIWAGVEDAREAVKGGGGIGVADGFVQGGNEVEVLLAGFIVAEEFSLQDVFEEFLCDDARARFVRRHAAHSQLQRVVSSASVAIRTGGDAEKNIVGSVDRFIPETAPFLVEALPEESRNLRRS